MKLIANMICRRRLKLQTRIKRWLLKILKGKAKVSIIAAFFALSLFAVCSAEEGTREGGLFSEGSFLSEIISSATGKINKVTSGEERIIDNDAKGIPKDTLEYDADPLGRPLVKPSFRKKQKDLDNNSL